jgi:hypothetical protein
LGSIALQTLGQRRQQLTDNRLGLARIKAELGGKGL